MELQSQKKVWVTLTGLPLRIELEWPFHRSTSGADFWVLHGDIRLENSEGLHAPVAVNLSATVREVMASLEDLLGIPLTVDDVLRRAYTVLGGVSQLIPGSLDATEQATLATQLERMWKRNEPIRDIEQQLAEE